MAWIILVVLAIAVGLVGVFTRRAFFKTAFIAGMAMFAVAFVVRAFAFVPNAGVGWGVVTFAGLGAMMAFVRRRPTPTAGASTGAAGATTEHADTPKPKQVLRMVPTDAPANPPPE